MKINPIRGFSICLLVSIGLSIVFLNLYDGARVSHHQQVAIFDTPGQNLAYTIWEPTLNSPDRENKVVMLYHGFSAQQAMMNPLMRELTARGYWVLTVDIRGHGASGGEYAANKEMLLADFDTVVLDAKTKYPTLNWTHIALAGQSMGGFSVLWFGNQRENVISSVGIAPAGIVGNINYTNPKNIMIIAGDHDQLFAVGDLRDEFASIYPNIVDNQILYNSTTNSYHGFVVAANAGHDDELYQDSVLSEAVTFIEVVFGYIPSTEKISTHQTIKMIGVYAGVFIGLIAVLFMFLMLETPNQQIEDAKVSLDNKAQQPEIKTPNGIIYQFVKYWYLYWFIALIPAMLIFGLASIIIPAGFGLVQVMLISIPGFASLLMYRRFIKRLEPSPKPLIAMIKEAWQSTKQEFNKSTIKTVGITLILALTFINFGFGQLYITMFPMNLRALYLVILIPVNGIMFLFQSWLYFGILFKQEKSFEKIVSAVLFAKFGLLYGLGVLLLIFGSWYITFIVLLTIFDVVATLIMLIVYKITNKYGATMIWSAIFLSTVYIGFGVYMGWFNIVIGF